MFFQPPAVEPVNNTKSPSSLNKSARRKRKKNAQKLRIKRQAVRKVKQRFELTMSSWAENFTMASTWQLKHQVAHWKSKATALEYENKILRDLLRHYYVNGKDSGSKQTAEAMSVKSDTEEEVHSEESDSSEQEEEKGDVELSEEFIEFLKGNAEFRKMREERNRLRKLEEEMPMRLLEAGPKGPPKDVKAELMELYGSNWERVAILEMSVESKFMADCDEHKPVHWPNIPLRI